MKAAHPIGYTEFHEVLQLVKQSQIFSVKQLERICIDSQWELNRGEQWLDVVKFFERYYSFEWNVLQLRRLGSFVKAGHFRKEFELYV
jgi:hypothetical protein